MSLKDCAVPLAVCFCRMTEALWLRLSTVVAVLSYVAAQTPATVNVKMVAMQPDKSVLHKVIGRDHTGQAIKLAITHARADGLLKKLDVE